MKSGASSAPVFAPALPGIDGRNGGYRRAPMARYRNKDMEEEESEDELLLKHGQTKRFVVVLPPEQLFD